MPYSYIARKGTSPLHELIFCVGQDAPLKLPHSRNAYKGTSLLHKLLFCVEQDLTLKLPYDRIAYKGTSPLHEQLFSVRQDSPEKMPYSRIVYKGRFFYTIFKGDIEIAHLLPEWSARQDDPFFVNLTTFEWRSGLKKLLPSQNLDFENGAIVKISKS